MAGIIIGWENNVSQRGDSPFVYRDGTGWPALLPYIRKNHVSVAIGIQSLIRLHKRVPMVKIWGSSKNAIDVAVSTYLLACWLFHAITFEQSSFRENPTYFLTSVRRWVCELVFDEIYDRRSEFSNNRQNKKALKCKPSALIFGHGRAKKSIALQGSYNIGIHVKFM